MKLRAPAIPLITVDPYFSVWSEDVMLNAARTIHWTGAVNNILGTVTVDGQTYSFLGFNRNLKKMTQTSLDINALSTIAVFETDSITLNVRFTTPLLPDNFDLMTRPVSYMAVDYSAKARCPC